PHYFTQFTHILFYNSKPTRRDLTSFPTRRSSDLRCPRSASETRRRRHRALSARRGNRAVSFFRSLIRPPPQVLLRGRARRTHHRDRKSTRLNSSHVKISYAVFCLKKKNNYMTYMT